MVYVSSGKEVKSFDVRLGTSCSWKVLESYDYNKEEINQIACSSKASFLAAADDGGDIKIVDICQQRIYKTLRADTGHTSICKLQTGTCMICSLVDDHDSSLCPYTNSVPKNATVSSGCDVVCSVCDSLSSGRCCNQDARRAKLKFGDHWRFQCVHKDRRYVNVLFDPCGSAATHPLV